MQVTYTPQQSDAVIKYQFGESVVLAIIDGEETLFDLSNIAEGQKYRPHYPLMEAEKKDGELFITLINQEEGKFKAEYDEKIKTGDNAISLEAVREGVEDVSQTSDLDFMKIKADEHGKHIEIIEQALMEMAMEVYK